MVNPYLTRIDMNIVPNSLQFVQVESDTAYIDSRVYCAEVIEVDHIDWVRDTLRKHQSIIEHYFGVLRFETDKPTKGSAGGRPEVYALLTEDQCAFALTLSRNTAKTTIRKAELIAEFAAVKRFQKEQLERQLAAINALPQMRELTVADYRCTFWKVHHDSGISCPYYVRDVITDGYDYRIVNGLVCVTYKTYCELLMMFRSQKGAIPWELTQDLRAMFWHNEESKMNRRSPQLTD